MLAEHTEQLRLNLQMRGLGIEGIGGYDDADDDDGGSLGLGHPPSVGRCRLTVLRPLLIAPMVSALETIM
jgi:hypothetical protein